MNEEQYRQVCEACDRVLLAPAPKLERMSIPWLHVLREHPSLLKDYEALFAVSSVSSNVVQILARKGRNFAGWLRQMWRALRSDGAPWRSSQALSEPVDVLFISHLLNDADAGKAADFYFGSLPEVIQATGRRVIVALIDHSENPDASRALRWQGGESPRVVLSDTLDLQSELCLYRRLTREASRLKKSARQESAGFSKKVLSRASLEALSGGARTALRLSVQVDRLVTAISPKMIVVTYEGHAWERVVFSAAREACPGLQCAGYQHAAIFRLQHAALRMLGHPYDPDMIFTAGAVSKGQIENLMKAHDIPVRVLGSNRAFAGSTNCGAGGSTMADGVDAKLDAAAGEACMVLPEGIISECLLLFEFSLNCAALMPDMRFIWRLHPLVKFESLIAENPEFQKLPGNVELSMATMEDDIARATYALYRGSTAIVKAACANVRPVYFALPGEMTIDPLYQLRSWRESVGNPEQFFSITRRRPSDTGASEGKDSAARYCGNFYMPIDPSVVLDILQSQEKIDDGLIDPSAHCT